MDKRTLQEQTALLLSVSREHMSCVRSLLEAGADPDISSKNKETPLYKGRPRAERATGSAQHGVAHTHRLQLLCGLCSRSAACELENADVVRLLLSYGATVNQRCGQGWMALHEAVSRGNTDICEMLIRAGASVNPPNTYSVAPLLVAAQRGRMRALSYLVEKGDVCELTWLTFDL